MPAPPAPPAAVVALTIARLDAAAACSQWPSGYLLLSDGRLPPAPSSARRPGADMLDAFIIDKIRREREGT